MCKFKVLGMSLALLVLLVMGGTWALAESKSKSTSVGWSMGSSCWITMTVHNAVDLGTPTGEGQIVGSTGNTITINNNCKGGIKLKVKADGVVDPYATTNDGDLPNGASVFDHFKWLVSSSSSGFTVETGKNIYTVFSGLNVEETVGASSNPAHLTVDIDYQYTTDVNDVPGAYNVTLLYTVLPNL